LDDDGRTLLPKCVFEVVEGGSSFLGEDDGGDVEAVVHIGIVLFGDVLSGGFDDAALFFVVDVELGGETVVGGTGFDFDENSGVAVQDDEVDFVATELHVAIKDAVTLGAQVSGGVSFALFAERFWFEESEHRVPLIGGVTVPV
jgi:hypothetical protein